MGFEPGGSDFAHVFLLVLTVASGVRNLIYSSTLAFTQVVSLGWVGTASVNAAPPSLRQPVWLLLGLWVLMGSATSSGT